MPRSSATPARHADHPRRLSRDVTLAGSHLPAAFGRLATLVTVGAIGAGALAATAPADGQRAVADSASATPAAAPVRTGSATAHRPMAISPEGRPVPHLPTPAAAPRPAAPKPVTTRVSARPQPWLPTGTGMWIYQWDHSSGGDAARVVRRARQVGLSTLYLRTGSTHDGLSGAAPLRQLLRASAGTALHVVAWDFPELRHPRRDAWRLAAAARIGRSGHGPHVAAVAPDIETPAEGTFNAGWRVRTYLHALRNQLPADVTILTAVPWPSRYRIADYPYRAVAGGSDALIPMAYWYNNGPAMVTAESISYLRRFHKPVQPVGQGYDGKLDVPSLRHNHLAREVPRFFATARRHGVRAVSLWSWQAAPPTAWRALARAHRMFPSHH